MSIKLTHPNEKLAFPTVSKVNFNEDPEGYIPSPELTAAVNVALVLGQPLLLTGEPGTGKTGLAHYLAHQLKLGDAIVFNAQTISTKKDLFYQYDALGHFHWAQTSKKDVDGLKQQDFEEKLNLIRYDGLGLAIRRAAKDKQRSVVLIDEIDKAPRDLPNDLLTAIEELSFDVPEISGEAKVSYRCPKELKPIVIITSNSEKNLPDAFLRRVIYFHIKFPEKAELLKILKSRTKGFEDIDLDAIADYFEGIRGNKKLNKNPATAELIAWSFLISYFRFPTHKLQKIEDLNEQEREILRLANSVLAKTRDDLEILNLSLGLKG
jgi:MoxR-like ATPase